MDESFAERYQIRGPETLATGEEDGIPWIVIDSGVCLCAYVGVPLNSPIARMKVGDDRLNVHGGVTFSQDGDGDRWPADRHWIGWDYGHFMDVTRLMKGMPNFGLAMHEWTLEEVIEEAKDGARQVKILL